MKSFVFTSLLLALGGTAFAAQCTNGSLQTYINLGAGGCQFGAVTFSSFQIVPGQNAATPISPTGVLFTPGGSTYTPFIRIGLTNPTAISGGLLESIFRFSVSGSRLIGASLALAGSVTGDGLITNVLDVCPDASFSGNSPGGCSTAPASAITFIDANNQQLTETAGPFAASFFDVFVDLTLDGGASGSATLSSATVGVLATPEPSAGLLFAFGLAAIAGLRSRRS